jgi:DNA-binding MarR family transcriptional regulator
MTPSRSKVTLADYRLLAELRYSLRLFASFSEGAAKSVGLHSTQHQALLAIKGFPGPGPANVGDLAERLCVRHHSAVGLVDRLIDEGYVRRTSDSADRRRVLLSLTARGERILERLSLAHRDELARIGPHIESLLERLRAPASAGARRPRKGFARRDGPVDERVRS